MDLAEQEATQRWSQPLRGGFDGLRRALSGGNGEHVEAHFHRVHELLASVGLMREDLLAKRDDLAGHVDRLRALLAEPEES